MKFIGSTRSFLENDDANVIKRKEEKTSGERGRGNGGKQVAA